MNPFASLDDLYLRYTAGLLSKKELEGLVFRAIQEDMRQFGLYHWKRDDRDDYLSWLYPRISNAIDTYRDQGFSFDHYVAGLVRMAAKEFRSRQADNYVAEYAAWTARYSWECVQEPEPGYSEEASPAKKAVEKPKNPRQILFLILKCYHCVSDDFIGRAASLLEIRPEILKKMIDRIRALRQRRDMVIGTMRERVYAQFYRCIVYEKRLAAIPEDISASLRMKTRLEKARQRLAAMRKRLAGMRSAPSNAQIAKILGVSKGTVDAGLYALKNRWNNEHGEDSGPEPCGSASALSTGQKGAEPHGGLGGGFN
ncbi:MAG: hypothetical protein LBD48_14420 [Treponema sp.]|jgi:hypothetical protein|nr:hypothetical protein [Treponema sp.]